MSFGSRNSFSALVEPVAAPAVAVAAPAASTSSSSSKDAGKDVAKPRRDDNKGGARGPRREGGARTGGARKPRGEGALGNSGELPVGREERKPRGGDRRDRKPRAEGEADAPRRGRTFDRHSGTGRNDTEKKQGAGRHNWGKNTDNTEAAAAADAKVEGTPVEGAAEAKVEVAVEPKEEDKSMTLAEYEKSLKAKAVKPPTPSLGAVETSFGANFSKVPVEEEFLQVKLSAAASSSSSSSSSSGSSAAKTKKAKAVPLSIPVGARERRDYGDRPERSDRNGRSDKNAPKLRGVHVSDSEFPSL